MSGSTPRAAHGNFSAVECERAHPVENVLATVSTIITQTHKVVGGLQANVLAGRDHRTASLTGQPAPARRCDAVIFARHEHTPKFKVDCQIAHAVRADMRIDNAEYARCSQQDRTGRAPLRVARRNSYACHPFSQEPSIRQGQAIARSVVFARFWRRARTISIDPVSGSGSPKCSNMSQCP